MRALREAAIFAGAMLAVALALFAAGWLLIHAGGWVLRAWFAALWFLPRSLALALAVMLSALTVYAALHVLARRRRGRVKA